MTSEQTADAVYGALAAVLLSRADAALRRGDVAGIAEAKRQAVERDRQLGSMRPQDIDDLVSKLDAKLEAAKAYRDALTIWPGAQSARVALMTLALGRGDRQEAARLAEAAETEAASGNRVDPWWTYWLGDYRAYPAIVAKLREIAR